MDTLVFLEKRVAPGLNGGAAPPPPGVIPNFENPPDAGRIATIAVFAVCYPLSTALFATRIYSKIVIIRQLVLEDGRSCVTALFLSSSYAVLICRPVTCFLAWVSCDSTLHCKRYLTDLGTHDSFHRNIYPMCVEQMPRVLYL
jgi:hypothetical protein